MFGRYKSYTCDKLKAMSFVHVVFLFQLQVLSSIFYSLWCNYYSLQSLEVEVFVVIQVYTSALTIVSMYKCWHFCSMHVHGA